MSGGQLALAIFASGLGFAMADFADRYLATYDPSAYTAAGSTLPTDRITGGNGTLANTLNIAAPPSMIRLGAGLAITAAPLAASALVKDPLARAGLQGMGIGAGVNLFKLGWNAYVIGNLLKPAAGANPVQTSLLGLRLFPAEMIAAQNMAAQPQGGVNGQPLSPGLGRPALPAPVGRPMGDVGPVAKPAPAPMARPAALGAAPDATDKACGCLGDQLPVYLGFASAA